MLSLNHCQITLDNVLVQYRHWLVNYQPLYQYSFNKGTCHNGMSGWEVSLFPCSANAVTGFMLMTACFSSDFDLNVHPHRLHCSSHVLIGIA